MFSGSGLPSGLNRYAWVPPLQAGQNCLMIWQAACLGALPGSPWTHKIMQDKQHIPVPGTDLLHSHETQGLTLSICLYMLLTLHDCLVI